MNLGKVNALRQLIIAAAAVSLVSCAQSSTPSDEEILKHELASTWCYSKVYLSQANQNGAPRPLDVHALRLCYVGRVPNQEVSEKARQSSLLIEVGRSCEKLLDSSNDEAMGAYQRCVFDGLETRSKGAPTL